jgi:hypothetical protein
MIKSKSKWLAASLTATLVFACASQKEPAEQAVANIDAALGSVHDTAAKYAPDGLQSVEAQIASLKVNFANGDYKGVLSAAPTITTTVAELKQTAEAKQAEAEAAVAQMKQQWRTIKANMPKMIAAVQSRVDTLSNSQRMAKGVSKRSFESAKAALASLNSMWAEATRAVENEDYAGAVAKGRAAKDKAAEIMHALGMTSS